MVCPEFSTSSSASSSMCSSTAAANARISRARSPGATAFQDAKAWWARSMAVSVSSTDVEGTLRSGAPVDGLISVVVMRCSHPLEGAGELPVGHVGVEGRQLDVGHVDVVVDDL